MIAARNGLPRGLVDPRRADDEINQFPQLTLAFADNDDQKYVAVTGRGVISNDRAAIRALFSIAAKAWWDSSDDPNIRLLTVVPTGAEYWDGRGQVASALSMAVAAATGSRSSIGKNEKISMA